MRTTTQQTCFASTFTSRLHYCMQTFRVETNNGLHVDDVHRHPQTILMTNIVLRRRSQNAYGSSALWALVYLKAQVYLFFCILLRLADSCVYTAFKVYSNADEQMDEFDTCSITQWTLLSSLSPRACAIVHGLSARTQEFCCKQMVCRCPWTLLMTKITLCGQFIDHRGMRTAKVYFWPQST